jgi:hypothetical protein
MKSRTARFTGNTMDLQELRDWVMMSCADLEGDCKVTVNQRSGGMNNGVTITEITVREWDE